MIIIAIGIISTGCIKRIPVAFEDRMIEVIKSNNVLELKAKKGCKITKCFYSFGDKVEASISNMIELNGKELQIICEITCGHADDISVYGFKSSGLDDDFYLESVGTNCPFLVTNDGNFDNSEQVKSKFKDNLLKD